jgi:hypothetical protein
MRGQVLGGDPSVQVGVCEVRPVVERVTMSALQRLRSVRRFPSVGQLAWHTGCVEWLGGPATLERLTYGWAASSSGTHEAPTPVRCFCASSQASTSARS